MMEIQGQYAKCKVFAEEVEDACVKQIYTFLNHPAFANQAIRIMPDTHAGSGAVIGFTAPVNKNAIIPNVIGVDIGCGVCIYRLNKKEIDLPSLDAFIRSEVPSGFSTRSKSLSRHLFDAAYSDVRPSIGNNETVFKNELASIAAETEQGVNYCLASLGTLGGGNHFIEVDKDEITGDLFLIIHSGSRNFGLKIANFWQQKANAANHFGALSFLSSAEDCEGYLRCMRFAQEYASLNRAIIAHAIRIHLGINAFDEQIESVHNFIGYDNIIRKGAISAYKDQKVVIPWNMRDGVIIGVGLGNEDWNNSAPHGAGRKMGRGQAKRELSMDDFAESMQGIWTSCVCQSTLDEAPMAYKDSASIEAQLCDTVKITHKLKPIYNFKSGT